MDSSPEAYIFKIRDRQVSLAMGIPMVINDLDSDIEDLTQNDFPTESEETAEYVMAQANLSRISKLEANQPLLDLV